MVKETLDKTENHKDNLAQDLLDKTKVKSHLDKDKIDFQEMAKLQQLQALNHLDQNLALVQRPQKQTLQVLQVYL